ncbi:MAG: YraN family protein [Bacteroidota bacterium]
MPHSRELGKQGEQIAADYLRDQGYEILERNWRHRRAEIDLIVQSEGILVFVEVKTRRQNTWQSAERSVNAAKRDRLSNAASAYMAQVGHEWELRFDLLVVVWPAAEDPQITHYEDAFFRGW